MEEQLDLDTTIIDEFEKDGFVLASLKFMVL